MTKIKKNQLISSEDLKKRFVNLGTSVKKATPQFIFGVVTLGFILIEVSFIIASLPRAKTLLSIKAAQIWPSAFDPIARFVANIDWNTNTVVLDGTMSKAVEDNVVEYIWRIDDGTSLLGDAQLNHQFQHPGYYFIQLSVIDQHGQSDVATCQILIPPVDVEQITTQERLRNTEDLDTTVSDIQYDWAPKGTFFNYAKLAQNNRSYADLKSRYVESGCGLSNRGYNIRDVSSNVSLRNETIRREVAGLLVNMLAIVFVFPLIYIFVKKRFQKPTSS